jgi:hypothetical protein
MRSIGSREGERVIGLLSDKQLQAIDELAAGRKRVEVETSVDVSHAQLSRWIKEEAFIQRWELMRAELHERRIDKLWGAADKAIDVLIASLDEGDPKVAMDLLKLLGPGLIDVRRVREESHTEERSVPEPLQEGSVSHRCDSCGQEFKGAGALGSHRRTHAT